MNKKIEKTTVQVFIWGTGHGTQDINYQLAMRGIHIIGYIDNNQRKWSEKFKGSNIYPPQILSSSPYDYIIIASMHVDAIKKQLLELQVEENKIIHYESQNPKLSLSTLGEIKYLVEERFSLDKSGLNMETRLMEIQSYSCEDVPPLLPIDEQYPMVKELLAAYNRGVKDMNAAPEPFRPGKNWANLLAKTRPDFYDAVKNDDVQGLTLMLNHFLRNSLCSGISGGLAALKQEKEHVNDLVESLAFNFKTWLYSRHSRQPVDLGELALPQVGNPYGIKVDGHLINADCFRHFYRAQWFDLLLTQIHRPVVAEIGGGFGLFAYYWLKQKGKPCYINFDLPENLLISSYYLSMLFPEKEILLYYGNEMPLSPGVFQEFDIIMMPNYMVTKLIPQSVDLFLNTVSFSEMDYPAIEAYIKEISRSCRYYYYHKNLAQAPNGYLGFPAELFPQPGQFELVLKTPSRWSNWGITSARHSYIEYLYKRQSAKGVIE